MEHEPSFFAVFLLEASQADAGTLSGQMLNVNINQQIMYENGTKTCV